MPLFRIAVGYTTDHRRSEPVILAGSFDQRVLQAAIDSAPTEQLRFELGTFHFQRRATRSTGASVEPVSSVAETAMDDDRPTAEEGAAMLARIHELEDQLADALLQLKSVSLKPDSLPPSPSPAPIPAAAENAAAGDVAAENLDSSDPAADIASAAAGGRKRKTS